MAETPKTAGFTFEENVAVYRLKDNHGGYDNISVSDHTFAMNDMHRYAEQIHIQSGMSVYIINIPPEIEMVMDFHVEECPISFGITLESNIRDIVYKDDREIENSIRQKNSLSIAKANNTHGRVIKYKGGKTRILSICFDRNFAKMYFREVIPLMRPDMADFFGDNDRFYNLCSTASPFILASARSLLDCMLPSPKRELYIKSKISEILNQIFADFFLSEPQTRKKSVLQPEEVETIKKLRLSISERLDSPLSIKELSKQYGMNDYKLKAGFKEVFGTTIFGCIHTERMEKAKLMLESGKYSVSETAWTVGYINVSNFIKAFKKQFDVTPGQFLFHAKSNITQSRIGYSR